MEAPLVALSASKGQTRNAVATYFFFFDDESVIRPMQCEKDGKCLIQL